MNRRIMNCVMLFLSISAWAGAQEFLPVAHEAFQAVNADGISTFGEQDPPVTVALEGIILNAPELILDPTPGTPTFMGGQWQIYIQGEGDDHAGTALWMGQYYNHINGDSDSYTNEDWINEICRLNHDPNTGYLFQPGDRVRVTGRYLFFRGKLNINENHFIDPEFDFTLELVEPAVGLPQPEVVALNELQDDEGKFIFVQDRSSGCEHYQGRLIRINNVSFTDPENWGPDATLHITDGSIRTFPVKLGIGRGFEEPNNLPAVFDVIGILDQEDETGPFREGYRLWVPNYDGNGLVLTDRGYRRGNLPADVNHDGRVDLFDLAKIATDWLKVAPGIGDCP